MNEQLFTKDWWKQQLNELEVNNPILKSPLKITSQEQWDRVWPILKKKGYILNNGDEIDGTEYWKHLSEIPWIKIVRSPDKRIIFSYNNKEHSSSKPPGTLFESDSHLAQLLQKHKDEIKGIWGNAIRDIDFNDKVNVDELVNQIASQIKDDKNTGEHIFGKEIVDYVTMFTENNENILTEKYIIESFPNQTPNLNGIDKKLIKEYYNTYKQNILNELFNKLLSNINKISNTQYIASNEDNTLELKYIFRKQTSDDENMPREYWDISWNIINNTSNMSELNVFTLGIATMFKIINMFIEDNSPNYVSFSGDSDKKTSIYTSIQFINKFKSIIDPKYSIRTTDHSVIVSKKSLSASNTINKMMENYNISYDRALSKIEFGDIEDKGRSSRWKAIKQLIERKVLSELEINKPKNKGLYIKYKDQLDDEINKYIKSLLEGWESNFKVIEYLMIEYSDIKSIINEYVVEQMKQDEDYEGTTSDVDILEYIKYNKDISQYLAKLIWKYYFKAIDINDIKKQVYEEANEYIKDLGYGEKYTPWSMKRTVDRAIENLDRYLDVTEVLDDDQKEIEEYLRNMLLGSGKEELNESKQLLKETIINKQEYIKLLLIAFKYCINDLNIPIPKLKIINNPKYTQKNNSYGGYIPSENKIFVVTYERTLADAMRSLCHECYHSYQNYNNMLTPDAGQDGDTFENEANAYAGKMMRKLGKQYPGIFFIVCENNNNKIKLNELEINNPNKFNFIKNKWYTIKYPYLDFDIVAKYGGKLKIENNIIYKFDDRTVLEKDLENNIVKVVQYNENNINELFTKDWWKQQLNENVYDEHIIAHRDDIISKIEKGFHLQRTEIGFKNSPVRFTTTKNKPSQNLAKKMTKWMWEKGGDVLKKWAFCYDPYYKTINLCSGTNYNHNMLKELEVNNPALPFIVKKGKYGINELYYKGKLIAKFGVILNSDKKYVIFKRKGDMNGVEDIDTNSLPSHTFEISKYFPDMIYVDKKYVNNTEMLNELEVNNPINNKHSALIILNYLPLILGSGRNISTKFKQIMKDNGWEENGTSITTWLKSNINKSTKILNQLYKDKILIKDINNKPSTDHNLDILYFDF